MDITVRSFGAAKTVTGSCHLLQVGSVRILVDCGMFQGEDEDMNYEPFGFDPKSIDYLVVTHAHIDHIGRIPKLVKEGFRGKIIATKPTYHLARIMLLDSANVMAEEYKTNLRKALRRGHPEEVKPPLYDEDDVYEAMTHFRRFPEYHEPFNLTDNITVTYKNAGHILGSAFVEFKIKDGEKEKIVVFSGDLGMRKRIIIKPLEDQFYADYVFTESTYGNRRHKSLEESIQEFKEAIIQSFKDGGNIVIPTFAVERTQEVLYILRQLYDNGELPPCKVFLDSPLGISATKIFLQFPEYFNEETRKMVESGKNPFVFPYVTFTQTVEESKRINAIENGAIILAGSGMCTGGRVNHHLKHNLWRPESSVIFVGYQTKGSLGRKIIDGAKTVRIYSEEIAVKAKIYTINGFSSHADQPTLLDWLGNIEGVRTTFIVHGEEEIQEVFKGLIESELHRKAHIVERGERLYII